MVINNGHTLQVALPADFKSDVSIPIRGEHIPRNMLITQQRKLLGITVVDRAGARTIQGRCSSVTFVYHPSLS
jgi:hypothetical protein